MLTTILRTERYTMLKVAILQAQESIGQYCTCLVAFLEQIYSISA